MIAGLPIYKRPELFEAHNRFWQIVHEQIDGSSKYYLDILPHGTCGYL